MPESKPAQYHHISAGKNLLVCLMLTIVTGLTFYKVASNDFINMDDDTYVTKNTEVNSGLSLEGVLLAFKFTDRRSNDYWMPLTRISHMADCQFFGLKPGMHHLVSLGLHILNACLLFLFLSACSKTTWSAALAAGLFALHPVNVETVAWLAERKNILSTTFWMLTLLSYIWYAKKPGIYPYLVVTICWIMGLMSKPMLVTLPFLLLLIDFWPLDRIGMRGQNPKASVWERIHSHKGKILKLVAEKIPLSVISGLWIGLSITSLKRIGILKSQAIIPLGLRIENALNSYVCYIIKLIWPFNLAIHYPFPTHIPLWQPIVSGLVLLGITILIIKKINQRPYLFTGWFWYLGTFVPGIGLIQAGVWSARADRFAYVPCIGLFILLAWGLSDIVGKNKKLKGISIAFSVLLLFAFSIISSKQLTYWKNSLTVFTHAQKVTTRNFQADIHLAEALYDAGQIDAAQKNYQKALQIKPTDGRARMNYGAIFAAAGDLDQAMENYKIGLTGDPYFAPLYLNMALALLLKGELHHATVYMNDAFKLDPDDIRIKVNYYLCKMLDNNIEGSAQAFEDALKKLTSLNNNKIDNLPMLKTSLANLLQAKKTFIAELSRYQRAISRQSAYNPLIFKPEKIPAISRLNSEYMACFTIFKVLAAKFPDLADPFYHMACIAVHKGDITKAAGWLDSAIAKGFADQYLLKNDPDVKTIVTRK